MNTIMDRIRESEDDDWIGIAAAQDRKDLESLRAHLQLHAKAIPQHHEIVTVTILMRASHLEPGMRLPLLVVEHFDPGDSPDPRALYEDGDVKVEKTTVQCDAHIFDTFADFTIELKRRGYSAETIQPWPVWPDAPEN
ncbi:hypothetical protein WT72_24090 [Burkholderia pseudomultivorans]|uniref:hypothetical protein n=1 Tax=Burkholderia pseudomultivorans TaxID=1207504 RepID=UPI0007541343|nr:hypothetical protein [Burkholderia pseudomultivorans]KWI50258.1 hypothetical protein WT72_24090 [Burkholderia pseudomultivorans]